MIMTMLMKCQVVNGEDDFGWGAVVNFQKKANQSKVSSLLYCLMLFKASISLYCRIYTAHVFDFLNFEKKICQLSYFMWLCM